MIEGDEGVMMKRMRSLLLIVLLPSGIALSQLVFAGHSFIAGNASRQTACGRPVITYAQWIGKNLEVQGENFGEGATVLVDEQRIKTVNAENFSSSFLFSKKAKKKVSPNQAITLQVQNPDDERSDPFPFYSGFLLTMDDSGRVLHLNVGDRFLLFLPPQGEPPSLAWGVGIGGLDPTAMTRNTNDLPIPRAQGFFEAVHAGQVTINAEASPLCPPRPRWQCEQSGANFGRFDLVVVIEA